MMSLRVHPLDVAVDVAKEINVGGLLPAKSEQSQRRF
jgi:hypothetical protein